jgi:hypothetical protein
MNSVITKFNALPDEERSGRQLWQRIRFGTGAVKDVADIRLKISTYTTAISMTLHLLSLGSQGRVERRLLRQGGELAGITESINLLVAKLSSSSPEGSIMTAYSNDDKAFWRALRRELVRDGYPSRVIHNHKDLIRDYVKELGARGVFDDRMGRSRMSLATYADMNLSPNQDSGPSEPHYPASNRSFVNEDARDTVSSQEPTDLQHGDATEERAPKIRAHIFDATRVSMPANDGSSNDDHFSEQTPMIQVPDFDSTPYQPAPSNNKGKEKQTDGPQPEQKGHYVGTSRPVANSSQNQDTLHDLQISNGRDHDSAFADPIPSQGRNTPTEIPGPQPVQPLNEELTADDSGKGAIEKIEYSSQPKLDISPSAPLTEDSPGRELTKQIECSSQPDLKISTSSPITTDMSGKSSLEQLGSSTKSHLHASPSSSTKADISGENLSEHVECSTQSNLDTSPPLPSPASPLTPEIIRLLEKIGYLEESIRQQQEQIDESTDIEFTNPKLTTDQVWDSHLDYSDLPNANDPLDPPLTRNRIKLLERIGYLEELNRQQQEALAAKHHENSDNEERDGSQVTASEELETTNPIQETKDNENTIQIASSSSDDPERQKKPILLTDAIGRKFAFPFHFAATWAVRIHGPYCRMPRRLTVISGDGGAYSTSFSPCLLDWESCSGRPL